MEIDIGISEANRGRLVAGLAQVLADSYTLYLTTHNFHWNVTGPQFSTLHTLFETQYNELALAIDQIAERITALGHRAPGSYAEFAALTSIAESPSASPLKPSRIRCFLCSADMTCPPPLYSPGLLFDVLRFRRRQHLVHQGDPVTGANWNNFVIEVEVRAVQQAAAVPRAVAYKGVTTGFFLKHVTEVF